MNNWKDQLRKGNVIQTEFGILPICHISFGDFYVQSSDRKLHAKVVEPVKLTLGVIERNFGGKDFDGISQEVNIGGACYEWHQNGVSLFYTAGEGWKISPSLSTAHALQNWHWELTGELLEYKPIS